MKHTVTRRVATGALSAVLALSTLPAPAIAEAAGRAALAAQAEPQGAWRHDGYRWTFALQAGGLATGWQLIGGAWYLFDGSGTMLTGWQNPSGSWYHLSDSGAMTTGWLRWNHAWYWLAPDSGRMHQGQWLHEGGEWYYFDGSGAMATGWRQVGGKWYFLQESGAMAHDGYTEDGYYVGPDGAWDESGASDLGLGMAELTTADLLDPAATSAAFTITSDEAHPFAERIGAETVAPVGDMQNFRVTGVERLGTHAVRVSVEGELVDRGELQGAGIYFDKGSFADAEAVGVAGVSVRYAEATLLPEESAYDEQGGTFRLAVDAGSAQLLAGASASVPSDPAIEVQGVEAAGAHKAVVTVRVPGATAYDQLAALSQALHEGGLTVSGTNAGDVAAFLDAEGYDSVLEYLSPSAYFYVERGAGGKGWTLDADGGATVSLRLRMVAESGDFDLTYADLGLVSEGVEDEGWQLVDPNTYEFVAERLSADELAALMAAYGYDDAAEFLDAYAYALGAQVAEGVQLLGGATDEWGIEIPESVTLTLNAFNNVGLGATGEVGDPTLEAQAEETADEKIRLIGGRRVDTPEDADLVLYLIASDAEKGSLDARTAACTALSGLVEREKPTALVDLSKHFDAREPLLPLLLARDFPLTRLAAYAGWNTTSNAVGTALAEASLALATQRPDTSKEQREAGAMANETFLQGRILEDYFYLKEDIDPINRALKKAGYTNTADLDLEHNHRWATAMLQRRLAAQIAVYKQTRSLRTPFPVPGTDEMLAIYDLRASAGFPWPRTFEIDLTAQPFFARVAP